MTNTMKRGLAALTVALTLGSGTAMAELQPWRDYDIGEGVISMTTIKVDANMTGEYLAGLKQTWVAANNVAKELGHIADYHIYTSDLPASGEFNMVLLVVYDALADLAPSKARYDAFMEKWGEAHDERNREISQTYPDVREITGEYLLREITLK